MNTKQATSIWVLSDGLPGHVNQSIGITRALDDEFPHEHEVITVVLQLRHKLLRPLMRVLANYFPFLLSGFALRVFYQHDSLPLKTPSLIISAGGNTLFANIAIARIYGVANVFSGTTKGYSHRLLRLIFTVTPLKDPNNNVVLDLPPANFNLNPSVEKSSGRFYALLIGGEGAGYCYQHDDWESLASALGEISQREGIKWLLTTSRRTGEQNERLLCTLLPPECCEKSVWYATTPAKVVKQFLNESEAVFCTEDSLTMVSEAIYAYKPVITLQPRTMNPDTNDAKALQKYQDLGFIHRVKIRDLTDFDVSEKVFCQSYPDINLQIAQAVKEHCL
ncbi:MAG: mitochondrial fission ELM1 family protein [Pseudomonadales bacterium]|nr:mitochondrial fission ELM1 family protein [Pseudomonadales bacterium]